METNPPHSPEAPREAVAGPIDEHLDVVLPRLRSHCRRLTGGNSAAAEDLLQESCLRLLHTQSPPRISTARGLHAWLARVARNLWYDRCRSRASLNAPDEASGLDHRPATGAAIGAYGSRWEELWDARASLPDHQDLALLMRDYCGCGFDVIANILHCSSPTAARQLRRRALATLSARLFES